MSLRDEMRADGQARFEALSLEERIAACARAGELQVALYARTNGVDEARARAVLERNKQLGRTPCSFLDDR